jgi:hypothetical protein
MLKILFAKSGGLCAFPGCNQELICKTSSSIIGHICHIVAKNPGGPRGDADISESEINSDSNLILLCPTHHAIVDNDTETYTIKKLTEMKQLHEISVYEKIHTGTVWDLNFSQLYYINIPRISIIAAFNGIDMNFDFMERFQSLHKMDFQLIHLMQRIESIVQQLIIRSTSLPNDLSRLDIGQTIDFSENFRTKNMPLLEEVNRDDYCLKGTLKDDPYIYFTKNRKKLILTLDPTWMTTTTSFANFSAGRVTVCGLATVKQINNDSIYATPYLLGIPKNPWDDLLSNPKPPRSIEIP